MAKDYAAKAKAPITPTMEAFGDWLREVTGVDVDSRSVALAGSLRMDFQASDWWKADSRNYLANVEASREAKAKERAEKAAESARKAIARANAAKAKAVEAAEAATKRAEAALAKLAGAADEPKADEPKADEPKADEPKAATPATVAKAKAA